ncbi:MAG: sigma 54-interacting transcriptional regulator [Gammaproteobacteria bacterium]|nr:sigma 54-interacting transcriptional regulator [Gammaproteobacteria bacterium]
MTTPHTKFQINDALILEATRLLTRSIPPEQKITGVLRLLSEWASLHYGRVLLPNYTANELQITYSYGLVRERLLQGEYNVPFDQGLTGAVWRSGQLALVTDVTDEPIFLTRIAEPIDGKKEGVGFISVPIVIEGRPIGVLSAQRETNTQRLYTQDVDLMRIIASMIGFILVMMRQQDHFQAYMETLDNRSDRLQKLCEEHGIIGNSPVLLAAVKQLDNAKHSDAPVLLLGESGTGKEMFAAMMHKLSHRRNGPYIALNCAAIPEQLLESELFGHEKGSFTGAHKNKKGKLQQAEGGTLFLDEIGDLQTDLQTKLLRVLQDRQVEPVGGEHPVEVDFRIITATHINLKRAVEQGEFRLDLFFRLNVLPVYLPPLRERRSDIPLLAEHFLNRYQSMYRRHLSVSAGVMERLQAFYWNGNIRQLQNVVERAVLQAEDSLITEGQIDAMLVEEAGMGSLHHAAETPPPAVAVPATVPGKAASLPATPPNDIRYRPYERVDIKQRSRLMEALKRTGGNQTRAAELLGMTLRQFRYRLAKLESGPL